MKFMLVSLLQAKRHLAPDRAHGPPFKSARYRFYDNRMTVE
jgi:hypothetical protein